VRHKSADMKHVEVNDLDVRYELAGEGYPLVLIIGLTAHTDLWDPQLIEALSKRFTVLTFDNRGAGRTVTPEGGDFSIEMFADDTAGLMDSLGIERAHALGHSMGGMIAQELVLKYPSKVNKLVLCSTNCGGTQSVSPSQEVLNIFLDISGSLDDRFERVLKLTFPAEYLESNPQFAEDFKRRYMSAPCTDPNAVRQFMAIMRWGSYDRLPEIQSPTLVTLGTEDILIPPENCRIIAKQIPGAKLVEYHGEGHGYIYHPYEALATDLLDFLDEE
jgi:pimeloyl-ACP methyl ester carboxylesterase